MARKKVRENEAFTSTMRTAVYHIARRTWPVLAWAGVLFRPDAAPAEIPKESRIACESLLAMPLSQGRVLQAGIVEPPFVATWDGGGSEAVTTPFCLVEGQASSAPGSDIRFEVWLPLPHQWNGRLLGVGAGGSRGSINRPDLGLGINRGYAAVATDNGHHGYGGYDSSWALNHPERVVDFGYRAHHIATEAAKRIVKRYYGRSHRHAFYFGCSQGGVKGMMAAQRYPKDYDGIIAGAPVYSWSREMTFQAWNFRALTAVSGAAITEPQMKSLYAAAVRQCGGPDGLIADPRHCAFDPAVLLCEKAGDACLTATQVDAVRKMYQGPRTSAGMPLNRGLTPGSESSWGRLWNLVQADPKRSGSWLGVYRYMVFANPQWDPASLNFDTDPAIAKAKLGLILDPDSDDLTAFRGRGGKLIVYHGWADDMVPAETSTDYHAAVVARLGRQSTDDFFRLFMLPGVAHCAGGPGGGENLHSTETPAVPLDPEHDLLAALEAWVERGQPPQHFVVTKGDKENRIERTRLVCPEPQVARFRGEGNPLDAAAWECPAGGEPQSRVH